ncbi:GNAT family N-acetyltransferase [Austwickia sp. TVS 96-490-7B]|uniref:GNAT family N-acetyltransferase n=1 Tax=Austwickia sp. TVS 96-490-7B TaxID=2830843 RepID=UPI001C55D665|nr:GNAT family N-acetyltransferase [Austwickia sp. TVS 96-490-7B]
MIEHLLTDLRRVSSARLQLDAPTVADAPALHEIYRDPLVWTHCPRSRRTSAEQTVTMLQSWIADWDRDGLGQWMVRRSGDAFGVCRSGTHGR